MCERSNMLTLSFAIAIICQSQICESQICQSEFLLRPSCAQAKVAELEEAIAKKDEELAEALAKIEAHEAEVKVMARRAALVEAGAEEEDIESILEAFAEATDEMFEQVVALNRRVGMKPDAMKPEGMKPKKKMDEEKEEEPKAKMKPKAEEIEAEEVEIDEAEAEAEEEVLENVEEETEAALTDAGDDVVEELRSTASDWLESNVLRSTASINK